MTFGIGKVALLFGIDCESGLGLKVLRLALRSSWHSCTWPVSGILCLSLIIKNKLLSVCIFMWLAIVLTDYLAIHRSLLVFELKLLNVPSRLWIALRGTASRTYGSTTTSNLSSLYLETCLLWNISWQVKAILGWRALHIEFVLCLNLLDLISVEGDRAWSLRKFLCMRRMLRSILIYNLLMSYLNLMLVLNCCAWWNNLELRSLGNSLLLGRHYACFAVHRGY